ncbi:hypothetical protein [Alteromonas ponticola]|uniref:Porin n=1 Tax=Alteromonas ponticola TaxID=2720613 RepID=A0ABX1R5J6_9ALTE|nr:hypothetical protein [Alteromonas ponticola]NMH60520.1 hypothetical protein [Alteromonas ponticola]
MSDSDQFGFRSDFSKPDAVFENDLDLDQTSKLGVQFDLIVSPAFDAVVQAVYRDQQDYTLDSMLNLAFVRYAPSPEWSLRVGRTAFDLFLLTEYRDIDFALPWAHVPSEIYGVIPHRFLDGVDLTHSRRWGDLMFSAKLFYGESEYGVTAYSSEEVIPFNLDNIVGVALDLQTMEWELAFNHTRVKFDSDLLSPLAEGITLLNQQVPGFAVLWPSAGVIGDAIDVNNREGSYTSISGQYRFQTMTVMSELAHIESNSLAVQDVYSGYVSGIFHHNRHNWYATFAYSHADKFSLGPVNEPFLTQIPGATELLANARVFLNFYSVNQKTFSIGWRWDFHEHISLKLQWDHTRIDSGGSTLWQPAQLGGNLDAPEGQVNTVFSNLSFSF